MRFFCLATAFNVYLKLVGYVFVSLCLTVVLVFDEISRKVTTRLLAADYKTIFQCKGLHQRGDELSLNST